MMQKSLHIGTGGKKVNHHGVKRHSQHFEVVSLTKITHFSTVQGFANDTKAADASSPGVSVGAEGRNNNMRTMSTNQS